MKYKVDRDVICKLIHMTTSRLFKENLSREELDYLGELLEILEQVLAGKKVS